MRRIGEDDGRTLLTHLLARSNAPSLPHFVRSMVGMDRAAAQEAPGRGRLKAPVLTHTLDWSERKAEGWSMGGERVCGSTSE